MSRAVWSSPLADTNLLLLSDGSPICANCSYSCNVCKQPILDEAIMAGDDSYHAHCFKCKVCKNRIDELVFAKTSNGIYCMKCHNERMIRIRKHTQKKAERERAQGGSGSSKSRDRAAREHHQDTTTPASQNHSAYNETPRHDPESSQPRSRANTTSGAVTVDPATSSNGPPLSNGYNVSVTVQPPNGSVDRLNHPSKQQTLPVPGLSGKPSYRRSASYDQSLRPPDDKGPAPDHGYSISLNSNSLSVTSKQQKRRSINPGLTLSPFSEELSSLAASTPGFSPRSDSVSHSASYANARSSSPHPDQASNSRRASNSNSLHSDNSLSTTLPNPEHSRSPSPSITAQDHDQQGQTVVLRNRPNPGGPHGERISAGLSPVDPKASFLAQQRSPTNSNFSLDAHRSGVGSRSASPGHRADVPHGVESGTDTEAEGDSSFGSPRRDSLPPALPPKDSITLVTPSSENRGFHSSDSDPLHKEEYSDGESSPVERTRTSTFIAPALPPIRFSLNPVEFSELLNSVNSNPLADLANQQKAALEASASSTPPPLVSASSPSTTEGGSSQPATPTAESSNGHASVAHSESTHSHENVFPEARSLPTTVKTPTGPAPLNTSARTRSPDTVVARLREALQDAQDRGAQQLKLDRGFLEAIFQTLDTRNTEFNQMRSKLDGMRRASKQYIEGLTVAQTEYDRELKARRDAEAEVTRLRVLLSGQAARLTALSGDSKRQEVRQQIGKDYSEHLTGLEEEMSRLKAERDMTLAEMEELSAIKSSGVGDGVPNNLGRALTKRLDSVRSQYARDLKALQQQREQLSREIAELKAVRDVYLEEAASLNARNEELAQLSAVYARRMDSIPEAAMGQGGHQQRAPSLDKTRQASAPGSLFGPSLSASTSSSSTIYEEQVDSRPMKVPGTTMEAPAPAKTNKFMKWPGSSKPKEPAVTVPAVNGGVEFSKGKAHIEHNFQQLSVLRFTRCDHCGDKMWGSQLKCTVCSTSIHVRCIANVQIPCSHNQAQKEEQPTEPLPPSMFGRELIEQVHADAARTGSEGERRIPVIVEKCIDAVDALALDYEGIYRKTGGSTQTKAITQLFERGDYASFDLLDTDRFNDICSVTSVLKTYFRQLPVPLLTFDLHDQFVQSVSIKDQALKDQTLTDLVNNLPDEHYYTLRKLMVHLHRVRLRCEKNRMTSRNLGVVFGPTLMRSRDPGAEFSDMAGKALFIEWLIDNAPEVFKDNSTGDSS
ncbi:hypothetical protein NMY22_g13507 [Coprinellus aureogranulatus]|nr:hypothetical protein NMY22_g13507 [Coprinellus aureogranulatus]